MFLTGFTSLSVLLLFPLSINFFIFMHGFDSISSNIDEVLSINPSANVFVFGGFKVHHKDWLTYSGVTNRTGKLCYHFSISNGLTQMVNFPTWILDCDSYSPAFLDLFISSDASICSTMAVPPLGNSDHQPWQSAAAVSNAFINAVLCGIYDNKKIAILKFFMSVVFIFLTY